MIRSGLIIMIKDFAAKGKRAGEISGKLVFQKTLPGNICASLPDPMG